MSASVANNGNCDWQKGVIDDRGVQDQKNKIDFYDQNAHVYDSGMDDIDYQGPTMMAALVHKYFKDNQDAEILSVAAGTGAELLKLRELGGNYSNVTGLDPAPGMLKVLQERELCSKVLCQLFHEDCGIPSNSYDGVISLGGFVPGHLQCDALAEMSRVVRPGGLVIIMCRDKYLLEASDYCDNKFRGSVEKLVKDGKWVELENEIVQNYCSGLTGAKFVFRKAL